MKKERDFFAEFKTVGAYKKKGQIYYATSRAKKLIKLTEKYSVDFWNGFRPISPKEQIEYVATGILGRRSFYHNINMKVLKDGTPEEVQNELTRARTINFIRSLRNSDVPEYETLKDGTVIITPIGAYNKWKKGEISRDKYIELIEEWKDNTEYKDADGNVRYAD